MLAWLYFGSRQIHSAGSYILKQTLDLSPFYYLNGYIVCNCESRAFCVFNSGPDCGSYNILATLMETYVKLPYIRPHLMYLAFATMFAQNNVAYFLALRHAGTCHSDCSRVASGCCCCCCKTISPVSRAAHASCWVWLCVRARERERTTAGASEMETICSCLMEGRRNTPTESGHK